MSRPIEHHRETVIGKAKMVFWRQGFERTSIDDLTAATGLGRGSLYNAFGSKHALYLRTLEHYRDREMESTVGAVLNAAGARDAVLRLLGGVVHRAEKLDDRRGCLLCNAAIENTESDEAIARVVQAYYRPLRDALERVLDAPGLADHIVAVYMGLQTMLRGGYPVETLRAVADSVLSAFPVTIE